jgi:hypothetical protein
MMTIEDRMFIYTVLSIGQQFPKNTVGKRTEKKVFFVHPGPSGLN